MKRNKSLASAIVLSAFTLFAASSSAFAQTSATTFKKGTPESIAQLQASNSLVVNGAVHNHDKGERGAKRLEHLQQRLNLTSEQTAKIKAILEKSRAEAKAAREQKGDNKEAFRTAMKDRIQKIDAEIQAVLTADQKTKYAELKAEMKIKHGDRKDRMKEGKGGNQHNQDKIKD